MRIIIACLSILLINNYLSAQEIPIDSLENIILEEVIVLPSGQDDLILENKSLGPIDNYLEKSSAINMIKRGAYAWEPMLQGMSSERSVLTIDGMRIYGACTDKMDPITSYVEITNLSKVNIQNAQSGTEHGGTIAGSFDLIRKKEGFRNRGWGGSFFSGFESNNQQKIVGTEIHYSNDKFYTDVDFTFRDAENYKAGGNKEILYSQFSKYNISAIAGFKINESQSIEASMIYDRANDVGYPALPMDVSLAEAFIASLQYNVKDISNQINLWETKIYFNTIEHIMDDSKRPDVAIRMDMPGWSETYGYYSKILGKYNKHNFSATLSGHFNNSLADMLMYSNSPDENDMYMMTWPDINTIYSGLFIEDKIDLSSFFDLNLNAKIGFNYNSVESEFGLNSLKVFYPEIKKDKIDLLKSFNVQLTYKQNHWNQAFAVGFGERSASISEAFGFYLFNSFDNYDYVGNPYLDTEKSLSFLSTTQFKSDKIKAKLQANYFRIFDYIIGKPNPTLSPMTIGANGIKVYEALSFAEIFNFSLDFKYRLHQNWNFNANVSYRFGQDDESNNLPLIQPFSYGLSFDFMKNNWAVNTQIEGNSRHSNYSAEFGETPKDAYTLVHFAVAKIFEIHKTQKLTLKLGVENLFDEHYSTFADWNNLPRTGRNLFINLIYNW